MIFWDSSCIIRLLVEQPDSGRARRLARNDRDMVVWWGTPVECLSGLARLRPGGSIDDGDLASSRRILARLASGWREIVPSEEIRGHAASLLLRHPLRAGDALQLGAALTWAKGRPARRSFATFDDRLAAAARLEGFELPLRLPGTGRG